MRSGEKKKPVTACHSEKHHTYSNSCLCVRRVCVSVYEMKKIEKKCSIQNTKLVFFGQAFLFIFIYLTEFDRYFRTVMEYTI